MRQVYKEFTALKTDPVEGIQLTMNEDDVSEIHATLEGPRKWFCSCSCMMWMVFVIDLLFVKNMRP